MFGKVLYFMDFPLNIGGANKVLLTQAYMIQQRGCKVLVVVPSDGLGNHVSEYDVLCKKFHLDMLTARYSVATCMENIDILDAMEKCGVIRCIVEDFMPDLIHSVQFNIAVEFVARELQIPHLMNIYPVDAETFHIDWLDIYPQYHCADSLMLSERWHHGLGIPSRCIRVAYGVNDKGKTDAGCDKTMPINIVSIGVLCEYKRQMEIIKFVLRCRQESQDVRLTILGDNDKPYGNKCKQFVIDNGLQEDILFKGFVSNVEDYLDSADLLIVASTVESYPGVIVESMANGVPVLSTPVGGVPELLKDGENGFLTAGFEANDIYQSFVRYLECRKSGGISQIVSRAYDTYQKHHSYAAVGKQLEEYYQWIIQDYQDKEHCFLQLDTIRKRFDSFLYKRNFSRIRQEVMRKSWFLYHILPVLEKNKNRKAVIWGAGFWGRIALEWIRLAEGQVELAGFIDMAKTGEYLGYPIIKDRVEAIKECGIILVAVENGDARLEIMSNLEQYGKVRNRDYFMVYNSPIRI